MIEVRHLSKRYGEKLNCNDMTFTVNPDVVTGFLGPNSAGKWIKMRLISSRDRHSRKMGRERAMYGAGRSCPTSAHLLNFGDART